MKATTNIAGKVLIAMPDMDDARFDRSVILLCAHSEDGAMGLRINLPTEDVALSEAEPDTEDDKKDSSAEASASETGDTSASGDTAASRDDSGSGDDSAGE